MFGAGNLTVDQPLNQLGIRVNMTEGGTFTLPIADGGASYNHNFTVYWGDDSSDKITAYNDAARTHTYAEAGDYNIFLEGHCEYFCFNNTGDKLKVERLVNEPTFGDMNHWWNGDIGLKKLNFYGCSNLQSVCGLGQKKSLTDVWSLFRDCTSLNVTQLRMFEGCPNITNFDAAFAGSGIVDLTVDLFRYNTKVTNMANLFMGCASFTTIPNDLFKYNTELLYLNHAFRYTAITSIPTDLFRYNTKVVQIYNVFDGCSALTSIPTDLFRYNTLATSFYCAFWGCNHIAQDIPGDIFKYNVLATNFQGAFYGCSALTGSGWGPVETENTIIYWTAQDGHSTPTNTESCFYGCTGLTDYASIPEAWK